MNTHHRHHPPIGGGRMTRRPGRKARRWALAGAAMMLPAAWTAPAGAAPAEAPAAAPATAPAATQPAAEEAPVTLEQIRVTMGKWIETQQIISKERKDWQQGREILQDRLDVVDKEIESLQEKIKEARDNVAQMKKARDEQAAANDQLKATAAHLADAVTKMEEDIRGLYKRLPEPIVAKLAPLYQRIPEDAAATKVSVAERYQNVLGILGEVNKANTEITVNYEVQQLAGGGPSEVKAIYIGLGQAYYVSATGQAGICRPTPEGWKWQSVQSIANDVLKTLEIIEGKHTPAFVPLPVTLQ